MKNTIQIVALGLAGMAAAQNGTAVVAPQSSGAAPSSSSAQSSVSSIPADWTAPISSVCAHHHSGQSRTIGRRRGMKGKRKTKSTIGGSEAVLAGDGH